MAKATGCFLCRCILLSGFGGGEHILAIGSDFDGCEINPELAGVDKIPALAAFLRDKGFDTGLIEKIFYENAYIFFKNILQNENCMI